MKKVMSIFAVLSLLFSFSLAGELSLGASIPLGDVKMVDISGKKISLNDVKMEN